MGVPSLAAAPVLATAPLLAAIGGAEVAILLVIIALPVLLVAIIALAARGRERSR